MEASKLYCVIEKLNPTTGMYQPKKKIHSIYLDSKEAEKAAKELYKKYQYDKKLFVFDNDDFFFVLTYIKDYKAISPDDIKLYIGDNCYPCIYPSEDNKPTDKGRNSIEFAKEVFEIYKSPIFNKFVEETYTKGLSITARHKAKIDAGLNVYHIKYFLEHFEEYVTKFYEKEAEYYVLEVDGNIDTSKL